jgi:hypothetical protein
MSSSVFRKALRWAERKQLVDHDSFLAFGMAAAFFTLGVCGLLGTDDILGECLSMLPPSLNPENASADILF